MTGPKQVFLLLQTVLLSITTVCLPPENLNANEDSKHLDTAREFADNVFWLSVRTFLPVFVAFHLAHRGHPAYRS